MKIRNFQRVILLFQTLLLCTLLNAQVISPTFLGIKDGMSSPRPNDVIQDSYGFLWVATFTGVQKYNGYSFQTFRNQIGDSTSLQNNICYGIMEDSNHNIWVSTDLGVSRLDRKTNLFKNYNFTNPEDRFSGRIQSVFEDSQKVLWATGGHLFGLKQYDEQKDKWIDVNFQYEDNIKAKDFGGWSLGMAEDAQGRLWTSQQYRGLFVRNPGDSIFQNVNLSMDLPVDFAKRENSISSLFVDSGNELWITTEIGIYRLNLETEEFKILITYPIVNITGWIAWNCVREDKNGSIWVSNNSRGLLRFDKGSDLVEEIKIDLATKANKTDWYLSLRNFCIDKSGIFWFGTDGKGIMKYDPIQKPFTAYTFQDSLPGTISGKGITCLYASEQNPSKIYVGIGSSGLDVFDENTKQFTNIPINSENNELPNSVSSIVETDEGTLLVGTYGNGILELDKNYTRINHYVAEMRSNSLIDNWTRVLIKGKDGKIWIGTRNGLSVWNRGSDTFKNFWGENGDRRYSSDLLDYVYQKFSVSDTISILKVGDNAYISRPFEVKEKSNYLISCMGEGVPGIMPDYGWIANAAGDTVWTGISVVKSSWAGGDSKNRLRIDVIELDPGQYTLNYTSDDSHSYGAYNESSPGNTEWWGIVLAPIDHTSLQNELKQLDSPKKSTNFLSTGNIYSIELTDSTAWIGTHFGGMNRINLKTDEVTIFQRDPSDKNSLSGDVIYDLCFDRDGFLWIATENGLNKFDIKSNTYTFYNQESGLPANQITSIVNGDKNEMWIGTQAGLSRMVSNPSINKATFINYFTSDGLSSDDFTSRSGLRSKSGTYYIGSVFGLNTFQSISGSQFPPDIVLTNLLISNQSVIGMGENSPLTEALDNLSALNLSYNENSLSFEYRALEYTNPAKNQYAHKLEGFDKDWIYDNRNFASYTNLEPGDYTLRIRASNAYGVWNEEGKSIQIHIASPWWRTWWAYTSYILIFGVLIFMINRFLRKRIADREREKNREKELAHAKEIEKAYSNLEVAHEDLKSAQDQLVQQEKMASLGELTAGIAHEIQNPLNFVNNFSEVSKELLEEMNEELEKGNLEDVKDISKDVIENLEKICHHGKRADSIVKGMLEHSRTSTGTTELTDINALADEYLRLAYHGLRAKNKSFNADLKIDFDDSIGKIEVVPQDVGRVLLNLFNNAFYAVDERKKGLGDEAYDPTVSVSTKKAENHIEIRVSDNGNGIPQKILDKIFQPFFTTKPTGSGTGLGLSLSYDIVKAHGGELKVETEENGGTTFIIQLPL